MPGVGSTDKDSIQQIQSPDGVFAAVAARICSRQFRPSKETMASVDFAHIEPHLDPLENVHALQPSFSGLWVNAGLSPGFIFLIYWCDEENVNTVGNLPAPRQTPVHQRD